MKRALVLIAFSFLPLQSCGSSSDSGSSSDDTFESASDDESAGSVLYYDEALLGDSEVAIEEGESMLDTNVLASLEVDGELTAAGPSVNLAVSGEVSQAAVDGMKLQVPIADEALALALADNLVVVYQVTKIDGTIVYGLIPLSALTDLTDAIRFAVKGFGNYQAVLTESKVEEEKTVDTSDTVFTKETAAAATKLTLSSSTSESGERVDETTGISFVFSGKVDEDKVEVTSTLGTAEVDEVRTTSKTNDTVVISPKTEWAGTSKKLSVKVIPDGGGKSTLVTLTLSVVACDANGGTRIDDSDACWILGDTNSESCTTICSDASLSYDDATKSFAGSSGSLAGCYAVATAILGTYSPSGNSSGEAIGCHTGSGFVARDTDATTASASSGSYRRFCACQ